MITGCKSYPSTCWACDRYRQCEHYQQPDFTDDDYEAEDDEQDSSEADQASRG